MYKADFLPYVGAGQIKLDSPREEVRKILGGAFSEYKKAEFSKNTMDDYSFFHVAYDEDNKVEAIDFFKETEFLFKDKDLFKLTLSQLKSFLKKNSIDFKVDDDDCLICDSIGLSFYIPKKIESICVYRKGYYDS